MVDRNTQLADKAVNKQGKCYKHQYGGHFWWEEGRCDGDGTRIGLHGAWQRPGIWVVRCMGFGLK